MTPYTIEVYTDILMIIMKIINFCFFSRYVTVLHGLGHFGQDAIPDVCSHETARHANIEIGSRGTSGVQLDSGEKHDIYKYNILLIFSLRKKQLIYDMIVSRNLSSVKN